MAGECLRRTHLLTEATQYFERGASKADRISQMPDEVLVFLLSLLTVEEAVATSILSSRWRHLWRFITRLDFDGNKALRRLKLERDVPDIERLMYVEWVTQVLRSSEAYTLDELKIHFDLPKAFSYAIDEWLDVAIRKRVSRLELDLSWGRFRFQPSSTCYTFPSRLFDLCTSNCPGVPPFKFLKALYLKSVQVTKDDLQHFLCHCPVIERLSIEGSRGFESLQICGLALPLKYLEIKCCADLKTIEICNTNLISFSLYGPRIRLLLVNVPHLVEVSFVVAEMESLNYFFSQLSCCLPQLRVLTFTLFSQLLPIIKLEAHPTLAKVKELVLNILVRQGDSLLGYLPLTEECPYLERVVLKLQWSIPAARRNGTWRSVKYSHQYLKVVEVAGYSGTSDFGLVMYLIENAVALEKVIIDPSCQFPPEKHLTAWDTCDEQAGRCRAHQQLVGKLPPEVKLIIL